MGSISILAMVFFLGFAIYWAIKQSIAQQKELDRRIEQHERQFPDKSEQYVRKSYDLVTKQDYEDAFEQEGLSAKWAFFEQHLKPEVRIVPERANEDEMPLGQSKIGGRPDMPRSVEWPLEDNGKHLTFLAQINLEELPNEVPIEHIPERGILYFFYREDQDFWGESAENAAGFRTLFIKQPVGLERRETPATFTLMRNGRYAPCKLSFHPAYSLPNWEHSFVRAQLGRDCIDAYSDITSSTDLRTKLFGHSNNVQGTMEYECEMVARGYNWQTNPEHLEKEIAVSQYQWKLLFQLDSEAEAEMMWGDVGKLYFWIREADLRAQHLDRTWMILQCH